MGLLFVLFQGLEGAETAICLPLTKKLIGMLLVEREPLRLRQSVLSTSRHVMTRNYLPVGKAHMALACQDLRYYECLGRPTR
jgi:hypothetical protein